MHPLRRAAALACPVLLLSMAACSADTAREDPKPPKASAPAAPGGLALDKAVDQLKVARENRRGYARDKFRLWVDADRNGCDARQEVLLAEAVKKPRKGAGCKLSGGQWTSYYDGKTVNDPSKLDIDHVVPLAEAWDSGASKWSAKRREAYANDLTAERGLVAVSSGPNRAKGDKDPAEWLPPAKAAYCTYAADWTSTKLRWHLTVDTAERDALHKLAAGCPKTTVAFTPAP
ncbi:HNH endonuclease family protein [Streptomyces monomycini]|uniref:HNH endonuclease family protein n=1 Tax=Streptomyces monomycini TaxID=371720 RepID=UPI0005199E64|nr:HNH endonuclease family protein [Streptomyces monomycini]